MAQPRIYSKGESIGPYEVVRVMATGGMAVVYEAIPEPDRRADLRTGGVQRVALKMAHLDERLFGRHGRKVLAERFNREFETLLALSKLGHPGVVRVYDFGLDDGTPYYVMEVVEGVTLGEALAQQPRVGQAMLLLAKVCGAVAFLHNGGIRHRDLKPSNIMVRADGGEPVLIDFGICLPPFERTLTGPHELLGTTPYLSPEYVSHWLDSSSLRPYVAAPTDDVWAIGVMLYEALAGESPWRTPPERRELLFREIQTVQPPHPSDVYKRAPRALGDVAMLLLEKNPDKRPASASAVLSLLGPAAEKSDVLSPIAPRRMRSVGDTSGTVPTKVERHPRGSKDPKGKPRGHALLQMAGAMAVAVLICALGQIVAQPGQEDAGTRQIVQGEAQGTENPRVGEPPSVDRDAGDGGSLEPQEVLSSSLDGGTEIAKLVKQALPWPQAGLSGQRAAPCPAGIEEIKGYCWVKMSLTAAQVSSDACDGLRLYEPSEGWCNAHQAGYKPFYAPRRRNNSVESQ